MKLKSNNNLTYQSLIDAIGIVKPVCEYDNQSITLRHDVDNDLTHAFKMAEWEYKRNIRSTYYLLPPEFNKKNYYGEWNKEHPYLRDTAKYYIRKIISFGHEIGLHSNLLTITKQSGLSPDVILNGIIKDFIKIGVVLKTMSSHGDTGARQGGYVNHQIFEESGRKDLGIKQLKLSDYNLKEAYFLDKENYLSDAGGSFALCDRVNTIRNISNIEQILQFAETMQVPSQVLIHPIWWE